MQWPGLLVSRASAEILQLRRVENIANLHSDCRDLQLDPSVLGLELMVVRREAGDMMDRWLQRWRDNLARYATLRCVKVILPWSTPSMIGLPAKSKS